MPGPGDAALDLLATLELEKLEPRVLEALTVASGAQGAALWLAEEGGLALRGLSGLVPGDALAARVEVRGARAAALAFGEPFSDAALAPEGGRLLPLVYDGAAWGLALLHRPARAADPALARAAGLALRNALAVRALGRRGAAPDEPAAFREHAAKELVKARRYGRCCALAAARVAGPPGAGTALAAALARAARDADVLACVGPGEHHVLLPETDALGALAFRRRALAELRREPALRGEGPGAPRALLGTAAYPGDGEDLDELLAACRARQEEQAASLLERLDPALRDPAAGFWGLADALLGGPPPPLGAASAQLGLAPGLFEAAAREALREIARDPRARGGVVLAHPAADELCAALPRPDAAGRDAEARVLLLGPGQGGGADGSPHPLVAHVVAGGDRRLADHALLLLLTGHAAYALLQAPDGGVFHTCDAPLVDALATQLAARYDLSLP